MTGKKADARYSQVSLAGLKPEEVRQMGVMIGKGLTAGVTIALYGELGAGKTYLIKAMCEGLDVPDPVTSPTFTIVNSYSGRFQVFHVDLYRLNEGGELDEIGIEEMIRGDAVCFFEWPERASSYLEPPRIDIEMEWAGFSERNIRFSFVGDGVWEDVHSALNSFGDTR